VRRATLIDFFQDLASADGPFLVHDDSFRTRTFSYKDVGRASTAFAARLTASGIAKGHKVVIFSENRPEWIVAFWGCLLIGAVVVPIDYRSSPDFLVRVARIVNAKVVLAGQDVPPVRGLESTPVWPLHELDWKAEGTPPPVEIGRDDVAEIIFTSGATAEPKGVVITHRNVLANIVPVEGEVIKYRRYAKPFSPIRFLNLLPLSHMFGQAMATFIPPMLTGIVVFMRGYNPGDIVEQIRTKKISVLVSVPKILDVLREHALRAAASAKNAGKLRPLGLQGNGAARACHTHCRTLVAAPGRARAVRREVLGLHRRRGAARFGTREVLGRPGVRRRAGIRPHRDRAHRHPQSPVWNEAWISRQGDCRGRDEGRPRRRDPRARRERHAGLLQCR
jgi:long-subunit acyl-CoA synthetase (AMP-forming)